ncbi:MAG: hypothetical protein PVF46_07645 [Lysobacterales bacterium]|jgi:hypothetical protein
MNKITDEDLVLLYYGEHDDPSLASRVAESRELSARFDALCAELKLADAYRPPHRGSDYGADVWQRISPRLEGGSEPAHSRLSSWLQALGQPRFSLAGALSVALVAVLAFTLGRNGGQQPVEQQLAPGVAAIAAGIDPNRLLSHQVANHLEQMDLVLTQFANTQEPNGREAGYATDMLLANRLYRQAATASGDHKLAAFLGELEPLLIEMAYEAQSGSPATRARMQREIKHSLLFRLRVMNAQLNKPEISV